MDDFDALLDAAVERRTTAPETKDVDVLLGEKVVTFRFKEIDSKDWAHSCAANPIRPDVLLDLNYGYNLHGAVEHAAPKSGVRVDGDTETELTKEQWAKVFKVLSGSDRSAVTDAVWGLNEVFPARRLDAAKKALTIAPKKKRPSPAS